MPYQTVGCVCVDLPTEVEDVRNLLERTTIINGFLNDSDTDDHEETGIGYEFTYCLPGDSSDGDSVTYNFDTIIHSPHADREQKECADVLKSEHKADILRRVTFTKDDAYSSVLDTTSGVKGGAYGSAPRFRDAPAVCHGHRPKSSGSVRSAERTSCSTSKITQKQRHYSDSTTTNTHLDNSNLRHINTNTLNRSSTDPETSELVRRKSSTLSRASKDGDSKPRRISATKSVESSQENDAFDTRRKSVCFDPELDKASAFIHGCGHNFSRASTAMTPPMKHGLSKLQVSYTETNLEQNQSLIFLDLLRDSHKRNLIRQYEIKNIERRLKVKRNNPLIATSFYEHKHLPDPFQRWKQKSARTVAQKKKERKEKIKKLTDEIHTGYEPTYLTMKIPERAEVEEIGRNCRYLRSKRPSSDDDVVSV